jgi:hypothetical protein
MDAYSSTTAFLAHYLVLSKAASGRGDDYPLSAQDHETLNEMRRLMEAFTAEDCAILMNDTATGAQTGVAGEERRRLERAELKLHRLLLGRGVVRG